MVIPLLPAAVPDIWRRLQQIPDPELPILTITDLGMVRQVAAIPGGWRIDLTPTYSGCPATEFLIAGIEKVLTEAGYHRVEVAITFSPPWSSDWMTPEARETLRRNGIAPPQGSACEKLTAPLTVACPRCGSELTEKVSEFGSSACKALYRCRHCLEPFDYFKCI